MFIQALLVAIAATLSTGWIWHPITWPMIYPLFSGFIVGIIMGDPITGMMAGATINLAYLGWITAGGSMPGNLSVAGVFGTALTILAKADPSLAITFAVPLSLVGILMWQLQMTINVFWVHKADRYAENADTRGIYLMTYLMPQLTAFLVNGVPAFLMVYFGGDFFMSLIAGIPEGLVNALEVAGGLMPALGIAMLLNFLGKTSLLPFFFIGFFASTYLGMGLMPIALFGASIAAYSFMSKPKEEEEVQDMEEKAAITLEKKLSKKDLIRHWLLGLSQECAYNYERLQATGTCAAMVPIIKKLYTTKEDISDALKRYLVFFNTEPAFVGTIIPGIAASMEEQKANGADISDEAISSLRTGLMGPMAGVGDTVAQGILYPTAAALGCSMALEGNAFGPVLFFTIYTGAMLILGYYMYMLGYRQGKAAVIKVLSSNMISRVTDAVAILGLMVIGAMGAERVIANVPLHIVIGESTIVMQDVLDSLIKNIVPLGVIMATWQLIRKKISATYVVIGILIVGVLAGYLGILGAAI